MLLVVVMTGQAKRVAVVVMTGQAIRVAVVVMTGQAGLAVVDGGDGDRSSHTCCCWW